MYEPLPTEKELRLLFPENKRLVIAEIGACEGEDTIKYGHFFPGSEIYAFEPLPHNIKIAKSNFKNDGLSTIKLIEKAISDKNGSAQFHISKGNPPGINDNWDYGNKSSSLLLPAKHKEISDFITFDQTIIVDTVTLDEFCRENNIHGIDFVHIDVQGAELMVLNGAVNSLRFIKAIWVEVSTIELYKNQPLAEDIDVFLNKSGFVMIRDCLYGMSGERLYIAKSFFPKYRRMFPAWTRRRSLLRKVLRQAGFD